MGADLACSDRVHLDPYGIVLGEKEFESLRGLLAGKPEYPFVKVFPDSTGVGLPLPLKPGIPYFDDPPREEPGKRELRSGNGECGLDIGLNLGGPCRGVGLGGFLRPGRRASQDKAAYTDSSREFEKLSAAVRTLKFSLSFIHCRLRGLF